MTYVVKNILNKALKTLTFIKNDGKTTEKIYLCAPNYILK
jgi:hypothetical protein